MYRIPHQIAASVQKMVLDSLTKQHIAKDPKDTNLVGIHKFDLFTAQKGMYLAPVTDFENILEAMERTGLIGVSKARVVYLTPEYRLKNFISTQAELDAESAAIQAKIESRKQAKAIRECKVQFTGAALLAIAELTKDPLVARSLYYESEAIARRLNSHCVTRQHVMDAGKEAKLSSFSNAGGK